MNKAIIYTISALIPISTIRRKIRKKLLLKEALKYNFLKVDKADRKKLSISIKGQNNKIIVGKLRGRKGKIKISIGGDNCTIVIDEGIEIVNTLEIRIGQKEIASRMVKNSGVYISKGCHFEQTEMVIGNSNAKIEIGENCMFSSGVFLYHTDGHPVFDFKTKRIINKVHNMKIGDHCWLGLNSTILKNVEIANDCIIGLGSMVTKSFANPHSAIAGNPARIVKENISWAKDAAGYIENKTEENKNA